MLILLNFADPIAVWGLAVAIIGAAIALIAAVAAIYAAIYAKAAPTKEDIGRVELNTAESTRHLRKQTERDELAARAERVSFSVWGQDPLNYGLTVLITCHDEQTLVTGIGLYNEHGTLFGTAGCVRQPDGNYMTEIDAETLNNWYHGGTHVVVGHGYMRVNLRVHIAIDGQETYRQFAASLSQTMVERDSQRYMAYHLEGAV